MARLAAITLLLFASVLVHGTSAWSVCGGNDSCESCQASTHGWGLVPCRYCPSTRECSMKANFLSECAGGWLESGQCPRRESEPHHAEEKNALEALYHSTNGPSWTRHDGWLQDDDHCQWSGVLCDEKGSVTMLTLGNNQLSGPIPAELGQLKSLTTLNLASNQLSGPIPAELGQMESLERLYSSLNQLSGPIPAELGQMESLEWLDLKFNQLSGAIPAELGQMKSLKTLFLRHNQFSCPIPQWAVDMRAINASDCV